METEMGFIGISVLYYCVQYNWRGKREEEEEEEYNIGSRMWWNEWGSFSVRGGGCLVMKGS